mgnify:CR=1 FL=1
MAKVETAKGIKKANAKLVNYFRNEKNIKEPVILATMEDVVSAEIFKDILIDNIFYFLY